VDYRKRSEQAFHSAQMSLCLAKVSRRLMLRTNVDGASMEDQHLVRVGPWHKLKTAWQAAAKPQFRSHRVHHRSVAWLTEACSDAMLCQVQLLKLQPRHGRTLMQQTKFYPFFLDFHHHQSQAYQVVVWGLHVDADPPVALMVQRDHHCRLPSALMVHKGELAELSVRRFAYYHWHLLSLLV